MLNIKTFTCNMLQENCYVVSDETEECIIIDCGAYFDKDREAITDYIRTGKLVPTHLVGTHAHIDHHLGIGTIFEQYGLHPEIPLADKDLMEQLPQQAEALLGIVLDHDMPDVTRWLKEGDNIAFGSHRLKVIDTPGHTRGSIVLYCEEEHVVFSGDTLFQGSIGRTDLPGGSMFDMLQTLRLLSQLPDNTKVYPGHGPTTTIGNELAHNPYMDR